MNGIDILGTGRYLPEKVVTNEDFVSILDTSDEWISTRTGMKERRFADNSEPAWYMGTIAAGQALESAGISASEVDMILVTTVTPDFHTPSTASQIQLKLGAANAFAFDISVACSGIAYAFDMARRYLAGDDVKTVLVVNVERLSQITNYEDRATCILFGDGAAASVLRASGKRFSSYLKGDAEGAYLLYATRPIKKVPFVDNDIPVREIFPEQEKGCGGVVMGGNDVYKFATRVMPEAVTKACEKLGIAPKELDLIIPHQANYRIIETAMKKLSLPMEKCHVNIRKYGNTSSASMAIGLDECVRGGLIKRGDMVCAVGFGAGLIYGACVFEY